MKTKKLNLPQNEAMQYEPVLYAVFKAISVTPNESEMQFIETIINGGKTDNTERASTICGYFDKQGNEKAIYDLLEARWL